MGNCCSASDPVATPAHGPSALYGVEADGIYPPYSRQPSTADIISPSLLSEDGVPTWQSITPVVSPTQHSLPIEEAPKAAIGTPPKRSTSPSVVRNDAPLNMEFILPVLGDNFENSNDGETAEGISPEASTTGEDISMPVPLERAINTWLDEQLAVRMLEAEAAASGSAKGISSSFGAGEQANRNGSSSARQVKVTGSAMLLRDAVEAAGLAAEQELECSAATEASMGECPSSC